MNRRRFLQALGAVTAGLAVGSPRRARASAHQHLLVVWVDGGWDPSYVLDPHIEGVVATDENASLADLGGLSLADASSRPSVRSFFERYGQRSVVVNGINVASISHSGCTRIMLTGTRKAGSSDIATLVGAETGSELALPALAIAGPRYPGSLGGVMVTLSSTLTGTVQGELPTDRSYSADREALIRSFLDDTAATWQDAGGPTILGDYRDGLTRLDQLTEAAADLTDVTGDTDAARINAAVAAFSGGLSRAVTLEFGLPDRTKWDSHLDNHRNQDPAWESLFDNLTNLAGALEAATAPAGGSLLEHTLVLVVSEMGRTPVLNAANGKDHWPYTSALLFGGGLDGGRVLGLSDEVMIGQPVDPGSGESSASGIVLTPAHLLAGLLESMGGSAANWFPGVEPFTAPYAAR